MLVETALAKVNLTLRVLGKRLDGYHELDSLVAFALTGDTLSLMPGESFRLEICGPGAGGLLRDAEAGGSPPNLVERAVMAALEAAPDLEAGVFRLEKQLPIAAGIGGGSADAAAALRLLGRANADRAGAVDWMGIAAATGADVPVCFVNRCTFMGGLGERVTPAGALPPAWIVLANPRVPLATADVFRALRAAPISEGAAEPGAIETGTARPANFDDLDALLAYVDERPNDLEAAAGRLCPAVEVVRSALWELEGALIARMSGSGPTCFALFASAETAEAGARVLSAANPGWWVAAAPLV
jgi:4-diphosphocytidyl-2-C-methyl-D-erythritol kinase